MSVEEIDVVRRERMRKLPIDGQAFKNLIAAGLAWLRTNHQEVNALNVFPVPDGDTGTNMVLTMQSAFDEIADSPEHNLGKMVHVAAHGALMGARGNSGVILSQILRGFARALDGFEVLDGPGLVSALKEARDTAYKGVVRPVEGTILTVIKDMATAGEEAIKESEDPIDILEYVVDAADESVERTPTLLAVLEEAGVVDAGGKGLYYIIDGMLRWTYGLSLETAVSTLQPLSAISLEHTLETIEPGQDYEVVVDFQPSEPLKLDDFYQKLEDMGTSIQVGEGDGIFRMHIHVPTENLYMPIDYTRSLGTITKVAIENLIAQMEEIEQLASGGQLSLSPVNSGQIATVAVAPGPGIARVFASLGVSAIVEGGQTMNPSTQQILAAFENLPTDQVIILPNNKNIVMAAKSACELTVKNARVVPSKTVPQGLAAMLRLSPDGELDQIADDMLSALDDVETGEITIATRSVDIDGVEVQEGEIIALHNGSLILAAKDIEEACMGFLEKAETEEREIITLFYGANIAKNQVNDIADAIRKAYPDQEVEVQEGGQPHYQFIFSVE